MYAILNMENLDEILLDIAPLVLEQYKDGKYFLDIGEEKDATDSEKKAYNNQKQYFKKDMKNGSETNKVKWLLPLIKALHEATMNKQIKTLQSQVRTLTRQKMAQEDKLKNINSTVNSLCIDRIAEARKEWIKEYKCENEDVMKLQNEKERLLEKNWKQSIKLQEYSKNEQLLKQEYKLIPINEWYEMVNTKCQNQLSNLNTKTKCKKCKKLKKEILQLKLKLADTSSSSSSDDE